jgi:ribonuclease P protein component
VGLPKANRLRNRRHFRAVYEQGIRRYSPHLTLRAVSTIDKSTSAQSTSVSTVATVLGISISKKVSKKAVVRNRIKRQLKGAFRQMLPSIKAGWKIVIIVKPKAIECKYEHFLRELEQLLIEATIINGY